MKLIISFEHRPLCPTAKSQPQDNIVDGRLKKLKKSNDPIVIRTHDLPAHINKKRKVKYDQVSRMSYETNEKQRQIFFAREK
jgi:hypothetical protein